MDFYRIGTIAKGSSTLAIVARDPDVEASGVTVLFVTPEERWAIFDHAARHYLHLSGEEFIKAWDAGEFAQDPDQPEIVSVSMLRPRDR